ncbi:glutaminase [Sporothrix brasiliensis 5110]|uniref:glutaminase n=1 Tax=Sporothrix brasiliensis 5110 TaxID=1398154 RepID=A0A0C2ETU1_9PEZI|nr:glutaminase [Sporothrix brasiliensis 5110]KIH89939.1 glutaminase [Sporothrix brasiliensis 5110]
MKSPIPDYLARLLENVGPLDSGEPASYIDVLATADTSRSAVALATVDGSVYSVGDDAVEFSIQSISKPFVYALAIQDQGLDAVLDKVGVEPSGDAFNRLSLEAGTNRPMNPMINAGAVATHALVVAADATVEQRVDRIVQALSKLAGRPLHVDEAVYEAELKDANRNMGIGYMLKAAGMIGCDPQDAVRGYIRQCSINVNVRDLAMMAGTLANAGVHPLTGERIMPQDSVRQVLSVMTTCGMYNSSGDWLSNVGIPAKSGVSGGIIGALPGQLGLAVFSPRLDERGNSVRGVAMCKQLSHDMGFHMMDMSQIGRASVRSWTTTVAGGANQPHAGQQQVAVFELRGAVRFAGAERLTRAIMKEIVQSREESGDQGLGEESAHAHICAALFSFRNTYSLNDVARRLIHENIRRLASTTNVIIVDPAGVLQMASHMDVGSHHVHVVKTEAEAYHRIGGIGCRVVAQKTIL